VIEVRELKSPRHFLILPCGSAFNFTLRFGEVSWADDVLPRISACADVAGYAVWFSLLGKIHRNTQAKHPYENWRVA
jgi:hypothetical protein